MRVIEVREYEEFELSIAEAVSFQDLLRKIWLNRRLNPTYLGSTEGGRAESPYEPAQGLFTVSHHPGSAAYRFRAGKYIGIFQTDAVKVIVTPKIFEPDDRQKYGKLLLMLQYANGLKIPISPDVQLSETRDNFGYEELIIYLFARLACKQLEKRAYLFYQSVQENTGYVRGKLMFTEHFRQNIVRARPDRVFCDFELFQEDNLFNRILKYVIKSLLSRTNVRETKLRLLYALDKLGHVADERCTTKDCEAVKFNGSQREFIPLLHYCRLFLSQRRTFWMRDSITLDHFILDMNDLYERFVVGMIQERFSPDWHVIPSSTATYLTEDRQFQLRYDILLRNRSNGRSVIIDTKYKTGVYLDRHGSDTGISSSDLYQMVAYGVRENADQIILVYPRLENDLAAVKHLDISAFAGARNLRISAYKGDMDNRRFLEGLGGIIDGQPRLQPDVV